MINTAKKVVAATAVAVGILSSHVAVASLVSSGPGLVYDSVANVTWSSDANLFATMSASNPNLVNQIIAAVPTVHDTINAYDNAGPGSYNLSNSDFYSAGYMDWFGAMAWTEYLNNINYLGHNTWMLPTTYDQTCVNSYNCTNSMLGELFYTGLGGTAGVPILSSNNGNVSLFTNLQNTTYWSGTEYTSNPTNAFAFITNVGLQGTNSKAGYNYLMVAFSTNGSGSVSEPASVTLLLLGLGLILGTRSRHIVTKVIVWRV